MRDRHWLRTHWDRVLGWFLAVAGGTVLMIGWVKVADTPYPAEQLPLIISGGMGGGLLVVFGAALLLSADSRDEWVKLDRIEAILRELTPDATPSQEPDSETGPEDDEAIPAETIEAKTNGAVPLATKAKRRRLSVE